MLFSVSKWRGKYILFIIFSPSKTQKPPPPPARYRLEAARSVSVKEFCVGKLLEMRYPGETIIEIEQINYYDYELRLAGASCFSTVFLLSFSCCVFVTRRRRLEVITQPLWRKRVSEVIKLNISQRPHSRRSQERCKRTVCTHSVITRASW